MEMGVEVGVAVSSPCKVSLVLTVLLLWLPCAVHTSVLQGVPRRGKGRKVGHVPVFKLAALTYKQQDKEFRVIIEVILCLLCLFVV
jgi:hypothetical protein